MRVLLVNAHGADLGRGGAEKYVAELASGLRRAGETVSLLAAFPPSTSGAATTQVTLHGTDWHDDKGRRARNHLGDLVSQPSSRLREAVEAERPDVVHTHNLPGITTAIWEVSARLGIPVVHTLHDYYLLCPRVTLQRRDGRPCCPHPMFCRVRSARLRRWARAVNDVIGVSEHVRRRHEGLFGHAAFHIVRVPITPLRSEPFPVPRTPPRVIGYLGALSHAKGITHLVEAAPQLAQCGYRLQVAGAGRLRHLVEAAAARDELDYVGLVERKEKLHFMESTDLAVLPSTWEEPGAPPYAGAEWVAARRPLIVTQQGGLREVADRVAGTVSTSVGAKPLVAAVEAVAEPTRWRELVASIPEPDQMAMKSWVARHRAIYELAAGRGPSGGNV